MSRKFLFAVVVTVIAVAYLISSFVVPALASDPKPPLFNPPAGWDPTTTTAPVTTQPAPVTTQPPATTVPPATTQPPVVTTQPPVVCLPVR